MYTFIYPSEIFQPKKIDESFKEEQESINSKGFDTVFFSIEDGVFNKKPVEGSVCIYRGWMLSEDEYDLIEKAVAKTNSTMLTSKNDYYNSHYLPNYYENIKEYTPQTVFCSKEDLDNVYNSLDWDIVFIKDYVKSLTTGESSIAHSLSEAQHIVSQIEMYRGDIEGGLSLREFVDFVEDTEIRYFVFNGKVFAPNSAAYSNGIHSSFANEIAKLHNSKFFTIDVIKDINGKEWVVEIGDGQVSDIKGNKGWTSNEFSSIFIT